MCPSPVFKTAVLGLARLHEQKIWIVCVLGCWLPDAPESSMSPLIKSRVDLRWNSANRPEGYVFFVCLFFLYHDGHSFPVFYRVLALVDGADPLQLFLCLPPPPGQAENSTAAEAERNQSYRLQRRLQLPFINAGPQYVCFILYHTCCSFWILN